jgi:hypothetical protein
MTEPKPERSLYAIASSFFAVVVIGFAVAGLLVEGLGDDGPISGGFAICALFLLLGIGRLYLGLRRPGDAPAPVAEEPPPRTAPRRGAPPPRRRRP